MYLRDIHIDGLKLLRNFELDFTRDGKPRMWTVLVGRNGLCKTSILRAIAIAASGQTLASQLAEDWLPSILDKRRSKCVFNGIAKFDVPGYPAALRTRTRLFPEHRGLSQASVFDSSDDESEEFRRTTNEYAELLRQLDTGEVSAGETDDVDYIEWAVEDPLETARQRALPNWFVAAYGTSRSLPVPGQSKDLGDHTRTRMWNLFDRGAVIGTGVADHIEGPQAEAYARCLERVLLNHADLLPGIHGFELRGRGGGNAAHQIVLKHRFDMQAGLETIETPATWLSHGYQSTIAWLADLVGHYLWQANAAGASVDIDPADMQGLVLIDELDLHLHPSWQVGLIPALKQTFPKLQFIVTTHSPMLLAGLEADEIVMLDQDPETGDITARSDERPPKLMTGTELLRRYFDVKKLYPVNLSKQAFEYARLASDPERSDEEDVRVQEIYADLARAGVAPDWNPVARRPS